MEGITHLLLLFMGLFILEDVCCEKTNSFLSDGKIVGGVRTSIKKDPYQVSLKIIKNGADFQCGGSILSKYFILTAAHCLYRFDEVYVIAGSTVLNDGIKIVSIGNGLYEAESKLPETKAKKFTYHPAYNTTTGDFDVGIVELSEPIKFDENKEPIKLIESGGRINTGTRVTVSGWGYTSENGETSNNLREVNMNVVSYEKCREHYGNRLNVTMFCTGASGGGKDSCQGDSGGPVVIHRGMVKVQIGIVSFGTGCGRKNIPGVNTNIANVDVRAFIKELTGI